jgi:hypothetical protein
VMSMLFVVAMLFVMSVLFVAAMVLVMTPTAGPNPHTVREKNADAAGIGHTLLVTTDRTLHVVDPSLRYLRHVNLLGLHGCHCMTRLSSDDGRSRAKWPFRGPSPRTRPSGRESPRSTDPDNARGVSGRASAPRDGQINASLSGAIGDWVRKWGPQTPSHRQSSVLKVLIRCYCLL